MPKVKPPQYKRKDSSAGKWVFILILCAVAAGAYVKRDVVMKQIHEFFHGPTVEQPEMIPARAAAPLPSAYVAPPVSTDPCDAYANAPAQQAACIDQMKKIQRMRDDAARRDKSFETPPPPPPGKPGADTNTTGH